jgi:hypothetical protein
MWPCANGIIIIIIYSYTTNNIEVLPFKTNNITFLKIKVTIQSLHNNDHKRKRNELSRTWPMTGLWDENHPL